MFIVLNGLNNMSTQHIKQKMMVFITIMDFIMP